MSLTNFAEVGQCDLAVLGDAAVGKSAISLRQMHGFFVDVYDPTIEDYCSFHLDVDGKIVKFRVLDTAGQEEFRIMRDQVLRKYECYLLVYSIANRESFSSISNKLIRKMQRFETVRNIKFSFVLVGNKCDLPDDQREVTTAEGKKLAKKLSCPFFETSALDGTNCAKAFEKLWKISPQAKKKKNKKRRFCILL